MSEDRKVVRNWNPRQVVDGVYQVTAGNPLNFADYAYALRNGSGTVAELLMMLGKSNVNKLKSGRVSKSRHEAPEDMPLIVVTGDHWKITQAGMQRYSASWRAQGITPPRIT